MDNRNLTINELQLLRRKAVEAVIKEGLMQPFYWALRRQQ